MILSAVSTAIRSRITSDSTLVTLLGSSSNVRFGQVPNSADISGNLIVYSIFGQDGGDTSGKDIEQCEVSFVVEVKRNGSNGPTAVLTILDRLHGDAVDQSDNAPTYGFHRLEDISLPGSFNTSHRLSGFRRVSFNPIDTDKPELYVAYEAVYSFLIQTL